MSIKLSPSQYAASVAEIDPRSFAVLVPVSLPVTTGDTVNWRDFLPGQTVTGVPVIYAAAAINDNQIGEI